MIDVKGITKRFGSTLAVDNVSFKVPAGQVLGFLGPNGAGKSTTMRVLTCYLPADEGTASIAGFDIFTQSLEIRRRIGYLPENAPLYVDMEVPDFLKFIATVRKIPTSKIHSSIDQMVDICGLTSVMHKKISELSKGYRQRVGLAQAMIHNPDILVLDEPTSGLDPNQIIEIRELIRKFGKEKTIILSTHILQEVTAVCDRILIINEGKLVADGSPEELTSQASGESTMWVTINASDGEIQSALSPLQGITSVAFDRKLNGRTRMAIKFNSTQDPSEEIFKCVVNNGWLMTEMHQSTATLEDVFARLTT